MLALASQVFTTVNTLVGKLEDKKTPRLVCTFISFHAHVFHPIFGYASRHALARVRRAPSLRERAMISHSEQLLDEELEELRRAHLAHVVRVAARAAARSLPSRRGEDATAHPSVYPSVDSLIFQRIETRIDEASAVLNELQVRFHALKRRKIEQSNMVMKRIFEGRLEQLPKNGGEPALRSGAAQTIPTAAAAPSAPAPAPAPAPLTPAEDEAAEAPTLTVAPHSIQRLDGMEELMKKAREFMSELPVEKLLALLTLIQAQEALVRLEHTGQADLYATAAYRFAVDFSFSEAMHVAEVRTSRVSASSIFGGQRHSVPFSFIDYFLKGVTRFFVDYHLYEDAYSFEEGDKIVKISHAAFGMESSTAADPGSSRPGQNNALE